MAVVCQCIRDKDRGGGGGGYRTPAAWLGCWIWLLACPLPSSWDAGVGDWQPTLSLLQLWGSPGAKMQRQHTPGVRTGRPGHRCSTRALCGVEWHIAASLMAVSLSLQVLEGNASRCSGHHSHTHPGRGTHTLSQQQKKEHLGDTEMLKWGQNFYSNRNQEPQPRDWFCSTSGCTLWAGGLWISVSAWCISTIWAFEKKKKSSRNKASELHETCMGWGVVIQV